MKKYAITLLTLALLTSCQTKKLETFSNTSITAGFDTFVSIKTVADSQEQFDEYFTTSIDKFEYLNQLFDIYNSYTGINNLKTINDNAGIAPVKVDQPIIDLLLYSKEFYDISGGEFDITIGATLKVWHEYREAGLMSMNAGTFGGIPTKEELDEAAACRGWQNVEVDDENDTVFINNPCTSLDVGGIAKGFAAEIIANDLSAENVSSGFVNAGGNVRTIGTKWDDSPWVVEIQNPDGAGEYLTVSRKGTSSFVTSGDYQRYYIADDGNFYHHIIDPQTNFPATYFHSVTIITTHSDVADALSTTLFTLSYEDGLQLIEDYNTANPETPVSAVWLTDTNQATSIQSDHQIKVGNYIAFYTADLADSLTLKGTAK